MASDKKVPVQDDRLAVNSPTDSRVSRLASDRPNTEDREKTDSVRRKERFAMLNDVNTLLPVPPELPGYHLVWLTTTNSKDTLEHRFRLGYSLVKPEELPGFGVSSQKDSQVSTDRIMINEMVLAKISQETWLEYMEHLHHNLPQETMQNLRDSVRIGQDGKGRSVAYSGGEYQGGVADGYNTLTSGKKANFTGVS